MRREIIISGFGGQGVMALGKTLAEAVVKQALEVTWIPSYGPEMRGGTANCSLVISDKKIDSPLVTNPTELIVMNKPSLFKYENTVISGGTILVNSSAVEEKVERNDVESYYIPCTEIATQIGNVKISNMVMLGAYIEATKTIKMDAVEKMLSAMFAGKKTELIKQNIEALKAGSACIK